MPGSICSECLKNNKSSIFSFAWAWLKLGGDGVYVNLVMLNILQDFCACSRWGSSDSPDHSVLLGAFLVKFRAVAGQPEQQPLAFMSMFFYSAPLVSVFSRFYFPYNLTFMCILDYYTSGISMMSTYESSLFSQYFFWKMRWEAFWVHWTLYYISVTVKQNMFFCWRPVILPSSVKIKHSTPCVLHMYLRKIRR